MSVATQSMPPPHQLNGGGENGVAGKDTEGGANGANGAAAHKEPKFASGLILPPPDIKCECIQPPSAPKHR